DRVVPRRLHVQRLTVGRLTLDAAQSRHARDVLRLSKDSEIDLFDDGGAVATGKVVGNEADHVVVEVSLVHRPDQGSLGLTVAAAVPKGDRADWMVEKLSEIGVDRFIPLAAERSVVLPAGKSKHQRWERLAVESAKQSRRNGVMKIDPLTPVNSI